MKIKKGAFNYFKYVASEGNVDAMYHCGVILDNGEGIKKNKKEERPSKHTKEERPKSPSKKIGVVKIPEMPQDTSEEYPTAEIKIKVSSPQNDYQRKKVCQEINFRMQECVNTIPEKKKEEGIPMDEMRERLKTYFGIPEITNNGIGKLSTFHDHFIREKKRIEGGNMFVYYKKT